MNRNWYKTAFGFPPCYTKVMEMLHRINEEEAEGEKHSYSLLDTLMEAKRCGMSSLWWCRQFHKKGLSTIHTGLRYGLSDTENEFVTSEIIPWGRDELKSKPEKLKKELDDLIKSDEEIGYLRHHSFTWTHNFILKEITEGRAPEWKRRIVDSEIMDIKKDEYSILRTIRGLDGFERMFRSEVESGNKDLKDAVRASLRKFLNFPRWIKPGPLLNSLMEEMKSDLIEGICKKGNLPLSGAELDEALSIINRGEAPECFDRVIAEYYRNISQYSKLHPLNIENDRRTSNLYWKKYRWKELYPVRMFLVIDQYKKQMEAMGKEPESV